MTEKDVAAEKNALRKRIKSQRKERVFDPELSNVYCAHLAELCLSIGVRKVAAYLPYVGEPDIELFLDWSLENGIEIILPVAHADGTLSWVNFDGSTEIGIHGFAEAVGEPATLADTNLAVVPALAIGNGGMRLGKGKGYYDRALKGISPNVPVVAVIFEEELLDEVPSQQHDLGVGAALTPNGFTYFAKWLN